MCPSDSVTPSLGTPTGGNPRNPTTAVVPNQQTRLQRSEAQALTSVPWVRC
jgi:hypothetical protein